MIPLYNGSNDIIGEVDYNQDLDYWDGRNWTNGGVGKHKGFGQLDDGRFYIIYGSQWQGDMSYARICSKEKLIKEMIKSSNSKYIEDYPELEEIYDEKFNHKKVENRSKAFSVRVHITDPPEVIQNKLEELKTKIEDFQNLK